MKLELGKIDKKVEQFLERIIEADSHTVIKAYENQVKKLEEEKITISENIAQCGRPLPDFDDTFGFAATGTSLVVEPLSTSLQTLINCGVQTGMKTRELC